MNLSDKHIPQSHRLFWRRGEREREGRERREQGEGRRRKRIEGGREEGMKEERTEERKEERKEDSMCRACVWVGLASQVSFGKPTFLPTQSLPRLALRLCCKTASDFSSRHVIGMSEVPDLTNIFFLALLLL